MRDLPPPEGPTRPIEPPANRDLDRLMWHFWSHIRARQDIPAVEQAPHPQDPTGAPLPPGIEPPNRAEIPMHLPQWITPNFWAIPQNLARDICCLFYKTWFTPISWKVPDDRIFIAKQMSYEFDPPLAQNEVFQVQVLRSGQTLAQWEDICIDPTANNPAEHFALGGHYLPIPTWLRFDQSDSVTVRVQVLGEEGPAGVFPRTSIEPVNSSVKIVMQGWLASMLDRRSGVPRPVDPGYYLDNYGKAILGPEAMAAGEAFVEALMNDEFHGVFPT